MPYQDGTGPSGQGPRTGRGLGPCGAGFARGRGFGQGFGRGRFGGYGSYRAPMTNREEREILTDDSKSLEEELKAIKERLSELKAKWEEGLPTPLVFRAGERPS